MKLNLSLESAVEQILTIRHQISPRRSILVALSGIDGCGKGYLTRQILSKLKPSGFNVIGINGDGWLNLPHIRFNPDNPAEHFYLNAFRFDEMFEKLVLPLRDSRSIELEADFTEETATNFRQHLYEYKDVDIIILEAIYLLQTKFIHNYDLAFWVDCSFKTALDRALLREQEGLSAQETINAYQTIYFPAQMIHFHCDDPKKIATGVINNDREINREKIYPDLSEVLQGIEIPCS